MKVEADLSTIYSLLNDEKPDGVTVEKSGGASKAFNLNVDINIDLTTIASTVAASWILARAAIQLVCVNRLLRRPAPCSMLL